MILLTGVTGKLGRLALEYLLNKTSKQNIILFARSKEKAKEFVDNGLDVRFGDYKDYQSLVNAFNGIDKLLLISASDLDDRAGKHINAINAAKESGVKHIVYTSFQRRTETPDSPIYFIAKDHLETENHLKSSGLTYTIFKNGYYMDMIPDMIGNVLETQTIYYPAGNGKVSFVTRRDIAEALAMVLTTNGHENKSYEIANAESYSFQDVADVISKLSGKQIKYISPDVEEFKKTLAGYNIPPMMIDLFAAFAIAFSKDEMNVPDKTLSNLIGRNTVSLEEFLKSYLTQNK